jgi:RNA polymerase sigma-70 factor (ECF subfamily)
MSDSTTAPGLVLSDATDEELLAAHVAGDEHAFAELVRRHRDRLWAVALRTCRDPDDAADAVQDALISAYRRADTFRGSAKVTTWLHRIVVNACLDRLRAKKIRKTVALPEETADAGLPDTRDPIAEHTTRLTVMGALAQLPLDQRLAVTLVDLEGWSVDEAAQILECPSGTVKSRCHRGRARLHTLLRNQPDEPGVPPPGGDQA